MSGVWALGEREGSRRKLLGVMKNMLIFLIVEIVHGYICLSKLIKLYFKYMQFVYVNYTSIILLKKKRKARMKYPCVDKSEIPISHCPPCPLLFPVVMIAIWCLSSFFFSFLVFFIEVQFKYSEMHKSIYKSIYLD